MNQYKVIFTFFLFLFVIFTQAQTNDKPAQSKKTSGTIIKAHRGTIVPNIRIKVGKQAQVKYVGLPRLGLDAVAVPAGAIVVADSLNSYYYKAGIYYVQGTAGFKVSLPVPGIRLKGLPVGYRLVYVGEKLYFYYYGVFYKQVENSDNYEVIAPPESAVVDALPDGYLIKKVDGAEYYFINGVYYAEVDAPALQNKTGYEVVTIIEAY
jgi:hypothetical protein